MSKSTEVGPRKSQAGRFLVASPFLADSPYRQSVVLVVRHRDDGALGFVLNDQLRSSLANLEDFFQVAVQRGGRDSARFPGIPLFTAVIRWGAQKLDEELGQGIWMSTPARLDRALAHDQLWSRMVRHIGRGVLKAGLGIRSFPSDPRLN